MYPWTGVEFRLSQHQSSWIFSFLTILLSSSLSDMISKQTLINKFIMDLLYIVCLLTFILKQSNNMYMIGVSNYLPLHSRPSYLSSSCFTIFLRAFCLQFFFGSWTKFNLPMSSVWTSAMISARTNLLLWYTSAKI